MPFVGRKDGCVMVFHKSAQGRALTGVGRRELGSSSLEAYSARGLQPDMLEAGGRHQLKAMLFGTLSIQVERWDH